MPSPVSRPGSALACFGGQCHSFAAARTLVANANGDWQSLLPQVTVRSVNGPTSSHSSNENCEFCNGSIAGPTEVPAELLAEFYKYSGKHPLEAWNVGCSTGNIQKLKARLLSFQQDDTLLTGRCKAKTLRSGRTRPPVGDCKPGFVPELLENQTLDVGRGWRSFRLMNGVPFFMPCSSARGEDAAVLRSFFTDRQTGQPIREGTFLEIGGVDGLRESNTWVFELCLGWRGVIVEGHPYFFEQLKMNRRASLNLRMAACEAPQWVNYTRERSTAASIRGRGGAASELLGFSGATLPVECAPLGRSLSELNVRRLDFVSVDVEGSELLVLESFRPSAVSLGVVLVEVRADGLREGIMRTMIQMGMRYVGMIKARGNAVNDVINDCFVNATHMRAYFPHSRGAAVVSECPDRDQGTESTEP